MSLSKAVINYNTTNNYISTERPIQQPRTEEWLEWWLYIQCGWGPSHVITRHLPEGVIRGVLCQDTTGHDICWSAMSVIINNRYTAHASWMCSLSVCSIKVSGTILKRSRVSAALRVKCNTSPVFPELTKVREGCLQRLVHRERAPERLERRLLLENQQHPILHVLYRVNRLKGNYH